MKKMVSKFTNIRNLELQVFCWLDEQSMSPLLRAILQQQVVVFVYLYESFTKDQTGMEKAR